MTTTQQDAQVEAVARAIRPVLEGDSEIYWAGEYGRPTPQSSLDKIARAAIAALSTVSAPSQAVDTGEVARLRAALEKISAMVRYTFDGVVYPPQSLDAIDNIARASLEPQAGDV